MSRLERLITLLDKGSTASVRATAAAQLGQIAATRVSHPSVDHAATIQSAQHSNIKQEPGAQEGAAKEAVWVGVEGEWDEVIGLVQRILPFLQSRSTETRQAAALALSHISRAVGVWDPSSTYSYPSDDAPHPAPERSPDGELLSLATFDLTKLLSEGTLLLSSSGQEYAKLAHMTADELKRAQREMYSIAGLKEGDDVGVDMGAELAEGGVVVKSEAGVDQAKEDAGSSVGAVGDRPKLPPPKFLPGGLPPPKFAPGGAPLASTSTATTTHQTTPLQTPATASPAPLTPSVSPLPPPTATIAAPTMSASPSVEEADPYAGLSAREKNKLKRKRKSESKGGSSAGPLSFPSSSNAAAAAQPPAKVRVVDSPSSSSAGASRATSVPLLPVKEEDGTEPEDRVKAEGIDTNGAVIIDPGAKARAREEAAAAAALAASGGEATIDESAGQGGMSVRAGEWPWRGTIERLLIGLLAPNWETRHGSALGLKEILRLQAGGGGQFVGETRAQSESKHAAWAEDLACRLLMVFSLDRFGDYISDIVMAPVRETAAQALATLLAYMNEESTRRVMEVLVQMVDQNGAPPSIGLDADEKKSDTITTAAAAAVGGGKRKGGYVWQVRHSGLLGLKYLVAVKAELFRASESVAQVKEEEGASGTKKSMLESVVLAALLGLRDGDDDVRSAAASTLSPIADALVSSLPKELKEIVGVIWGCLGDLKDDLSSSVAGVMDFLARLLTFEPVLELIQKSKTPLRQLIPRLFPFFRHTIHTVRLAVLNTLLVFLKLEGVEHDWVEQNLLRLLYQNLIVEDKEIIRETTARVWDGCLLLPGTKVQTTFHIPAWVELAGTPIGTPLPLNLLWSARRSLAGGQGAYVYNVDKAIINQDRALVSAEQTIRGRVAAATALGKLLADWPEVSTESRWGAPLDALIKADSNFGTFLAATIVEEWATAHDQASGRLVETRSTAKRLVPTLQSLLGPDAPAHYAELTPILVRVRAECVAFYGAASSRAKVPQSKIPKIPNQQTFNFAHASQIAASFDALCTHIPQGPSRAKNVAALEQQHRTLLGAIGYYDATKAQHDRMTAAALAGAVVALGAIPAKVTPIIRAITDSIKKEQNEQLQARAARSIAALIDLCSSPQSTLKVNPSEKLVKNLCTFLCQDVSRTPIWAQGREKRRILTLELRPARGLAAKEQKEAVVESEDVIAARLVSRGAQMALTELAARFEGKLLERVPKLWSCMADALLQVYGAQDTAKGDALLRANEGLAQDLLDGLTVLPTAALRFEASLQHRLEELLPALACAARSEFAVVRYSVARSLAQLCDIIPVAGLRTVVEQVIPVLGDPLNLNNRRGAVELISHIVDLLDIKILAYVIFLVVPVLGRMSDPDDEVRLVATNTFASLVKLVPLEAGLPDPPGFSKELLLKRETEREFLTQLLDGSKVAHYEIPIPFGVELRKYQREGVSWLAFLAKYQLHGLLCDDMGLGKTAQSIAILASIHHERAQRFAATNSPDAVHLPSLIVCPPTLAGHWNAEILNYAKSVRPLLYVGPKAHREGLQREIRSGKYDAVITSYETVRHDIDFLGKQDWLYLILDEGHVIKNGKTLTTRAIKQLRASHRLILSGTPIQNNVLELWSLFDFLMPGFLGSEKNFQEKFGKPIAASRDAKSSSREQEKGALALEALHKQVLPFLLRRLKEDVLDDLPPKIIQDYYVELSALQKSLYDEFANSQIAQSAGEEVKGGGAGPAGGGKTHVFQALQYLRKLVNHPALVVKAEEERGRELVSKLAAEGRSLRDVDNAPKLGALQQILNDCGIGLGDEAKASPDEGVGAVSQHRVLIFCQLKTMLDIIERDLFKPKMPTVSYMRMDGSTDPSKRHGVVQTFNADPSIDVLLLTTHVGGLGLNLTGADTVIFVEHDWNPMKDLQAMDRAHRLGQRKVVNVYRLIMRGTLEEKIMGLQRFKLNIASSVVTQQNSDLDSLGTEGILDLFQVSAGGEADKQQKENDKGAHRPQGQKAILEGLGELQAEDEYADLGLESFTKSLAR